MTRDEAVALIQQQMAFRTTLATEIVTNLQAAQVLLEQEPVKPWFLIAEDSYIRTEADEERVPVPDDFLEEVDEAVLRYVPDDLTEEAEVDLVKDEYDVLRKNYADSDTGTISTGPPEAYCLLGNYFRIFPTPDDDYLIRMIYYKQDDLLTSNIENGGLKYAPFLLLGRAGQMIETPVRDPTAHAEFVRWEAQGRAVLTNKAVAREMAGRSMQVGGPH